VCNIDLIADINPFFTTNAMGMGLNHLNKLFQNINNYLVIDKAIGYGVFSKIWGLFSGVVTVFFISTSFSREQQGYFFTFVNILALQIFIELGLTYVLAQFASHEFAYLSWDERGGMHGDELHLRRLEDIARKSAKWFGMAALLITVVLVPLGIFFFSQAQKTDPSFSWRLPWILAVLGFSANIIIMPLFSIIMGSGDVAAVNYRELLGSIIGFCLAWAIMTMHGGLYAFCAITWGNAAVSWIYLLKKKPDLLKLSMKGFFSRHSHSRYRDAFSWMDEIWPIQWRMAISQIFGYFTSNLFNPILFYYQGAIVAGQMGMTLNAANALLGLSMTWMMAKSPEFGRLISKHEWRNLDNLFFRVMIPSVIIVFLGSVIGCAALWYLQQHYAIGDRFIPSNQASLLFGAVLLQVVINGFAVYLRAYKQEPFLVATMVGSILMTCSTIYLGKVYASAGMVTGYFVYQAVYGVPVVYIIWRRCRHEWQAAYN
jgi:hypothetical protein